MGLKVTILQFLFIIHQLLSVYAPPPEAHGFEFIRDLASANLRDGTRISLYRFLRNGEVYLIKQPAELQHIARAGGILQEIVIQEQFLKRPEAREVPILLPDDYSKSFVDHHRPWIAYKYYEHGDLFNRLVDRQVPFSRNEIRVIAESLLKAMKFLKNVMRMTHFDIKLENVIITDINNYGEITGVKLIDLEHSKRLFQFSNMYGTPLAISPENLADLISENRVMLHPQIAAYRSESADIWALGYLLYQASTAEDPFEMINPAILAANDKKLVYAEIGKQYQFVYSLKFRPLCPDPSNCGCDAYKDLIIKMLNVDPERRITIEEALSHKFFQPKTCLSPVLDLSN